MCTLRNAGLSSAKPVGLFILYVVYPSIVIFFYIVTQIYRVIKYSRFVLWPLGSLLVALFTFCLTQVGVFVIGPAVCYYGHVADGIFFGALGHLGTMMMIYRFWDSITDESQDLYVNKVNEWVVPGDALEEERRGLLDGKSQRGSHSDEHRRDKRTDYPPRVSDSKYSQR
jgi:hypothetical protein